MPVCTATHLSKHIKRVLDVYGRAGFRIRTILMDGEFEKVKPFLPTLECYTMAAKEHVSKAECTIYTLKERTRGLLVLLPFSHNPHRMKIEIVYFIVLWLNAFLVKSGISTIYSPRELLVHWKLDYKKHCRVLPGSYCEVHDKPVPTNTMVVRTQACIALGPTGNLQGSLKFYCLTTGRVLERCSFTVIPMPDRIIRPVNEIGAHEGQGRTFRFLDRRREPYSWTNKVMEDDADFQGLLKNEEEAVYPDTSAELPGVELETEEQYYALVLDEPETDFREFVEVALHITGINADDRIRTAHAAAARVAAYGNRPAVVEADEDKIVYEITFDLPDVGLPAPVPAFPWWRQSR